MQVYGLLGNPVSHSLSPPMHEAAYETLDIDARYVTFEPDPEALEAAIGGADALGLAGLNVTVPFKEAACESSLVAVDDVAARIGAVNTINFAGRPTGHNTDASGALRALDEHDFAVSGARAVVVGAGGAGRAIAFGLADGGADVAVANRTASRAHDLADDVPGAGGYGLEAVPTLLEGADLLVNATSVGMEEDASPVAAEALHGDLAVMDAVYRPLETRLLREAAASGATTIDGAWMLLYQGVEALELWTGREAPVEAMNAALRGRLRADSTNPL
ncbi:shikimate dehydrogenase [Saliphagus infecundisoli]|uniref:Shikimate dehydrogenase (NADP(+)) n=1 Tax=Saliphagus infecundisoli TaxID=1849069 RepID=A0ABD5QBB5_9EURY|nr:shikimate dehydrogenase [Saliphagus infecundisoli]